MNKCLHCDCEIPMGNEETIGMLAEDRCGRCGEILGEVKTVSTKSCGKIKMDKNSKWVVCGAISFWFLVLVFAFIAWKNKF